MPKKTVNSFKFLPRLIGEVYRTYSQPMESASPWTPFIKPLSDAKIGLITSAGIFSKKTSEPFDMERELIDPTWGDSSYRIIQSNIDQDGIGISHLHYNHASVLEDINILLPVDRLSELIDAEVVGGMADFAVSFMGFQGYPPNTDEWKNYAEEVANLFKQQEVDAVLLTPA